MKRRSQTKNFKDKVSATLEKQKQILMLKNLFEVQFVHFRTVVQLLVFFIWASVPLFVNFGAFWYTDK